MLKRRGMSRRLLKSPISFKTLEYAELETDCSREGAKDAKFGPIKDIFSLRSWRLGAITSKDRKIISRKDAKHVLNKVEGDAKARDGIKIVFYQEVTGTTEMNQKTSFPLFSPVRRGFFAYLASWREKFSPTFNKIPLQLRRGQVSEGP